MKKWTEEHGAFSTSHIETLRSSCGDFGTWRQAGISGGGHASVNLWRYQGEGLVAVAACGAMTPQQARQLARVLMAAADEFENMEAAE